MEEKRNPSQIKKDRTAKIPLPTTEKQLRDFVKKLCDEFGFTDYETVLHSACTTISHFPRDQAHSTAQYFADCYNKARAYGAAQLVGREVSGEIQARELRAAYNQDPTNQQIIDEIKKLSSNGVKQVMLLAAEIENASGAQQN